VGVLGANFYLRAAGSGNSRGNVYSRRATNDIYIRECLRSFDNALNERGGLGRLNIHLPITGNDFLAHNVLIFLLVFEILFF
jgi:hypothetical protein